MNDQYQITKHDFQMYPRISPYTWTSFQVFLLSAIIGTVVISLGVNWGKKYPNMDQRGRPQASAFRPMFNKPFYARSGTMVDEKEAERYAKAYVDEYAASHFIFTSGTNPL